MKLFLCLMFLLSFSALATDEQYVKVTQIKGTDIKNGMGSGIAEKWLDTEMGVVCYVLQKGSNDSAPTITCVNYK
ncbi:MAG: hypothetical protein JNM93_04705 [Bacteriovoracaceae bacterium]|nr:hypothetical protein [Bacteriovoracaceae bacterium]